MLLKDQYRSNKAPDKFNMEEMLDGKNGL